MTTDEVGTAVHYREVEQGDILSISKKLQFVTKYALDVEVDKPDHTIDME